MREAGQPGDVHDAAVAEGVQVADDGRHRARVVGPDGGETRARGALGVGHTAVAALISVFALVRLAFAPVPDPGAVSAPTRQQVPETGSMEERLEKLLAALVSGDGLA